MNKGQRKRKKTLRNKVVEHHIVYSFDALRHKQTEIVVPIWNTEHYICRLLQTRGKYVSKGFLKHLKFFIWKHEESAVDLSINNTGSIGEK